MPVTTRSTRRVQVASSSSTRPVRLTTREAALAELNRLTNEFNHRGSVIEVLRNQLMSEDIATHRMQVEYQAELDNLALYWQRRFRQVDLENQNLRANIEALNQLRAHEAQMRQVQEEENEYAQEYQGLGNFISAMTDNDRLEEKIQELKEEIHRLKRVQEIVVRECVAAEDKQADLEKEKDSWAVEKAQMMAQMSRMEAEASASNAVIAQLKAEKKEAHKAAALQSTANLALSQVENLDGESTKLTAMEEAKLSLKDEVVFEVMAAGARKRRAGEREEERASKKQC